MEKVKVRKLAAVILVLILLVFVTDSAVTKIRYANTLKEGTGKLVREYNQFFTLQDIITVYSNYIATEDYNAIKYTTENQLSKAEYEKISKVVAEGMLTPELKFVYEVSDNVYRCEFEYRIDLIENSDRTEEQNDMVKKYENGITDNAIVIELDKEKKQYKVVNAKFNI